MGLDGGTPSGGPSAAGYGSGIPDAGARSSESGASNAEEDHDTTVGAADRNTPDEGVDIGWGDKAEAAAPSYDGTLIVGGPNAGLLGIVPEPEEEAEAEAAPVVVHENALPEPGHLITGQLSLISLLLGLGIAALRMRRR